MLVSLASKTGEVYASHVFTVCGEYVKYECELKSAATDVDARLVLSSENENIVTLGFTSLFPKDTYMGRENGLRKSLAERLLFFSPKVYRLIISQSHKIPLIL